MKRGPDEGAKVYGQSMGTSGQPLTLVGGLPSANGISAWLQAGGQALSFDLASARKLVTALEAYIADAELKGEDPEQPMLPETASEQAYSLMERTIAIADEWRAYAAELPEGPVRSRALQLAATVYVERAMAGLPLKTSD